MNIYFDTNAFRYFGSAFEKEKLPADVASMIAISPLSAFEVFAQLGDEDETVAEKVLRQIHALPNWTNPKHSLLLPWPDTMLQTLWFQKPVEDDNFRLRMEQSFNVILTSDSLSPLKEAALQQKMIMDDFKDSMAQEFKHMLDELKKQQGKKEKQRAKPVDTSELWFNGVAKRAKAQPQSRPMSEVKTLFSAYHEFEQSKLHTALLIPEYNSLSLKNRNDIIDSEQLIYLGDSSLCMLTGDKGYKNKVVKSDQTPRIIVAKSGDLTDPKKAESVLRCALGI